MNDLDKPIQLYELISKVRTDLEAARTEGQGRGIRFKVEAVELELQMTAKRVTTGEGGIDLYVFKAGANHEAERGEVQTIKVRMVPELEGGGSVQVSHESPARPAVPAGASAAADGNARPAVPETRRRGE